MEHLYIHDTETGRSLWITKQEPDQKYHQQPICTLLTDGMYERVIIKESSIRSRIRDFMRWIPQASKVEEVIAYMELHEYTGEPTEQEMEERLKFWQSWSPNAYRDNHLRINHPCPCCGSDTDTEWVRNEWNVCYSCFITFTLKDLEPMVTPEQLARIKLEEEIEEEWYE